jgi:hypothetical protein
MSGAIVTGFLLAFIISTAPALAKNGESQQAIAKTQPHTAVTLPPPGTSKRNGVAPTYLGGTLWQGLTGIEPTGDRIDCFFYLGIKNIDVSNPASPQEVSKMYLPGNQLSRAARGNNLLYVPNDYGKLEIFDLSNPAGIELISSYSTIELPKAVVLKGDYAYVASYYADMDVVDISDPANPSHVEFLPNTHAAVDIVTIGDYLYVATGGKSIDVYSLADPAHPAFVRTAAAIDNIYRIFDVGGYLYVSEQNKVIVVNSLLNPAYPSPVYTLTPPDSGSVTYRPAARRSGDVLVLVAYTDVLIYDVSDPRNPEYKSQLTVPNSISEAVNDGNRLYLSSWNSGAKIFDISDLNSPVELGDYATLDYPAGKNLKVVGDYAFVAGGPAGLQVVDVSSPTDPQVAVTLPLTGSASEIKVDGSVAYLTTDGGGLFKVDISNPLTPTVIGTYPIEAFVTDLQLSGDYAYVTAQDSLQFHVIDITGSGNLPLVASLQMGGYLSRSCISGDSIYVASYIPDVIHVVDITDPLSPVDVSTFPIDTYWPALAKMDSLLFVGGSSVYDVLTLLDVSASGSPQTVSTYTPVDWPRRIIFSDDQAWMADYANGLEVLDFSTPSELRLAGSFPTSPGWAEGIDLVGDIAYLLTDNGLVVLQLSQVSCGDADGSGAVEIGDAVYIINYIFGGGPAPNPMLTADADCSGSVSIADAVVVINYIFGGGPIPCSSCP